MDDQEKTVQLALVEPVKEYAPLEKDQLLGALTLTRCEKVFELSWNILDKSSDQHITAFQLFQKNSSLWKAKRPFRVNCREISDFYFMEKNNKLFFNISISGKELKRSFILPTKDIYCLTTLIENLLSNGICVIKRKDETPYSLFFHQHCSPSTYLYRPSFIRLEVDSYESLPIFWNKVCGYFDSLLTEIEKCCPITTDPTFPLNIAAESSHSRIMEKINEFTSKIQQRAPITLEEFHSLFDSSGRIKDPDHFRELIFNSNIEESALPEAVPFIVGLYSLNSTPEERQKIDAQNDQDFKRFLEQVKTVGELQLNRNKKLNNLFRVISHDVDRTDRATSPFESDDSKALQVLDDLLRAYCLYNQKIGYLQGMNDLFVPFILIYLPYWDNCGNPKDSEGNDMDPLLQMPKIFWCFDSMMHNTNHLSILSCITYHCQNICRIVFQLVSKISPLIGIWLKENNLSGLLWVYSDIVLLYKRTFNNVFEFWVQFNTSPDPHHWLIYFIAATLLLVFPKIVCLENLVISEIMNSFPLNLAMFTEKEVRDVAYWIYVNYRLDEYPERNEEIENFENSKFEFFELE